jgi:hypothetical protein
MISKMKTRESFSLHTNTHESWDVEWAMKSLLDWCDVDILENVKTASTGSNLIIGWFYVCEISLHVLISILATLLFVVTFFLCVC